MIAALGEAMDQVDVLREEVEAGQLAEQFSERAQGILQAAPEELQPVLDVALETLFIEQLGLLQQQILKRFENDRRPATALERADRQFVSQAEELIRPGGNWSYAPERTALREALASAYTQDFALKQERARAAQTQRATTAVISRMQKQMEQLGEKLNGVSSSGPWALWTSYRIPGTPLRMTGRYQQGRTNIEFSLSPNKDPANAEAGFVEGLTSSNLGLGLNVGV